MTPLFESYRDALRSRGLLDYNDLIALAGELLRRHPVEAAAIRGRWDAVLVDEFQDLSLAQYEVIAGLSKEHRHCFAVGDDEQSIYSWAGADTQVFTKMAGVEVASVFRDRHAFRPGQVIRLRPDPARAHLFDAANGVRLSA